MLTDTSSPRSQAIQTSLLRRAGGDLDARAVAAATVGCWRGMEERLAPVIGALGVQVLFKRALLLASGSFAWLAIAEDGGDPATLLVVLEARLSGREAGAAREAGHGLLLTFTELLARILGESLTERLLSPVWAYPPARPTEPADRNALR